MNNRIVITEYNSKIVIQFIKDNEAVKIRALNDSGEMADTVYLGRISTVKPNINSSFVRFNGRKGFIGNTKRKPETLFPVMIKKETPGNKEDEVTDIITLCGLYTIVGNGINGISFSRRIDANYKNENEEQLTAKLNNCIIRQNAASVSTDSVIAEYNYLSNMLDRINSIADKRTDNATLYNGISKLVSLVFTENITEYDEILTDDIKTFEILKNFISTYDEYGIEIPIAVKFYEDKTLPLKPFVSFTSKLEKATSKKVYLKSDAYLCFDYTEAMNVIDVNSGTTVYKGNKEDVIHKINLEAIVETARQIKLRNLSGIIIVDLINEKSKENYDELIKVMRDLLKDDECHAKCHDITKLGLMEITRSRIEKTLREELY